MATRNFVIARTQEEAEAMAAHDMNTSGIPGFETLEQAQLNLESIKTLISYLPPTHGGTDYHIYHIVRQVILIS